jgi:hypothetical protein
MCSKDWYQALSRKSTCCCGVAELDARLGGKGSTADGSQFCQAASTVSDDYHPARRQRLDSCAGASDALLQKQHLVCLQALSLSKNVVFRAVMLTSMCCMMLQSAFNRWTMGHSNCI